MAVKAVASDSLWQSFSNAVCPVIPTDQGCGLWDGQLFVMCVSLVWEQVLHLTHSGENATDTVYYIENSLLEIKLTLSYSERHP